MEKIVYREDLKAALSKIEADLNDVFMHRGVSLHTALGAHLSVALSGVSSAISEVNQFEEK